jgi:hypothetical protein
MKKYRQNEFIDPETLNYYILDDKMKGIYVSDNKFQYIKDSWMKNYIKLLNKVKKDIFYNAIVYSCEYINDQCYYKIEIYYDTNIERKEKLKKLNEKS